MGNQEPVLPKESEKIVPDVSQRRKFFTQVAQSLGLTALGGLIWSAYLNQAKGGRLIIRPPAAVAEEDFLRKCIKCGQCVVACPYNALVLAKPGDTLPVGTPYIQPRLVPCYMCVDVPCVPVCPTEALDRSSLQENAHEHHGKMDINKARMGLAVVDEESCLAFWGIQCDACHRACPLIDKAITLEFRENKRTAKHAYLLPVVSSAYCTGCGLCEHSCVTEKAAIYVLPRKLAQGKVGSHYIKGWEENDDNRLKNIKENVTTTNDRSKKKAVDYLNDE